MFLSTMQSTLLVNILIGKDVSCAGDETGRMI